MFLVSVKVCIVFLVIDKFFRFECYSAAAVGQFNDFKSKGNAQSHDLEKINAPKKVSCGARCSLQGNANYYLCN